MNRQVNSLLSGTLAVLVTFSHVSAARAEKPSDSDRAMAIAKDVAAGIEELKKKYPRRLEHFSSEKHLRRIGVNGGFAPGTVSNPELASISYFNGIVGEKERPAPKKGGGKKRQAAENLYDAKTGVRIFMHIFKGDARGNDMRPAEAIGDLRVHLYVEGPAGKEMRADILKLLKPHQGKGEKKKPK